MILKPTPLILGIFIHALLLTGCGSGTRSDLVSQFAASVGGTTSPDAAAIAEQEEAEAWVILDDDQ